MSARDDLYAALTAGVRHAQLRQRHIDAHAAEVLLEAAEMATDAAVRLYDDMGQKAAEGARAVASRLRKEAAEALPDPASAQEPRVGTCGRTVSVTGTTYPPCQLQPGHVEAYCQTETALFLATLAPAPAQEPLVVRRFDTAMEPAPEEDPVLVVGAIAVDGRPVALCFEPEDRAKVGRWLTPASECGHDDYHDPHEWADLPHIWCPGHSHAPADEGGDA
ncbi:hypothetical protein ABZ714_34320 [Streptomyces sp. NPDC006798]|uniref:hypothetical protein n=1 Tax=unclassified Streptomyces TaxID=2593676 RepID=UPI0033223E74